MSHPCGRRETKRHATALRLQQCAIELTLDRGFDGWTMDDLAETAEVSRRTVFNYFDGKVEVVLGPMPEVDPARLEVFVAGGPTGRLMEDMLALVQDLVEEKIDDHARLAAGRTAVMSDPRVFVQVHARFEALLEQFVDHVLRREGQKFGAQRARLLLRLTAVIFDAAVQRIQADPGHTFDQYFADAVADARAVLA